MRYWRCLRNEKGTRTKGMVMNYKKIQKVIRTKIKTAKNEWLKQQQCEELEQLERIHNDFNLHRKIKETAVVCNVENDQGELAQDDQQRKIIWENYINNLFCR